MRVKSVMFYITAIILFFAGCENQQPAKDPLLDKPLAQVNDYVITVRDLNQETGYLNPVFKQVTSIPPEVLKAGILDEMITRELLLQEAQKMNLDKDKEFMKQVENFWRLSLIKQLWVRKTEEVSKDIYISDDEIKSEYARISENNQKIKPFEQAKEGIRKSIFDHKVQTALQTWSDGLKANAVIKKYFNESGGGSDGQSKQ